MLVFPRLICAIGKEQLDHLTMTSGVEDGGRQWGIPMDVLGFDVRSILEQ